jgi:hypothetical protein
MGLRFETAVGEAYDIWHDSSVSPIDSGDIAVARGSRPPGASTSS